MATLPYYRPKVTQRAFSAGAAPVDDSMTRALDQLQQGASQLAGAMSAANERESQTYVAETRNKATVEYTEFATNLSMTAKTGEEYLKGIAEFSQSRKQAAVDGAPNSMAAEAASQYWNSFDSQIKQNAIVKSAEINAQHARDTFSNTLDIAKTSVYLQPDSFELQMSNITEEINTLKIPESQKEQIIVGMRKDLNRSKTLGLINNDPFKAVSELAKGNQGLSAQEHENLTRVASSAKAAAEASFSAQQSRVDKEVNEMEKKVNEATAKNGYELAMGNSLSADWVTQNRDNLSQADYKYFTSKIENPSVGTSTDVPTYAAAYNMAMDDPVLAKDFAHKALLSGDLSISDFNKINALADKNGKGELPSAYKQASSYIRQISGASALNPAVGQRERAANAINDFNIWYAENPSADPITAVEQAKVIWSNYSLVDAPAITMASPYGTGVKSKDVTIEDLKTSAKKLQKDFQNGAISESVYNREVKRLNAWAKQLGTKE